MIKIPLKINPFLILGIPKNANAIQTKDKFREKLNQTINNPLLRAQVCLAYDIIVNKKFYKEIEKDIYVINDSDYMTSYFIRVYYYCVIGDCRLLINEIEDNPNLLNFVDPLKRNLLYIAARNGHTSICEYLINKGLNVNEIQETGSTPLHGAVYYGQINVVKLLLNYGAKTNIKNKYGHLPIDEASNKDIIKLLKESESDPIVKLYQSLLSRNIATKLIPIHLKKDKSIIAKKIICKLNNLPENYKSLKIEKDWIPAWHGTNFTCLESIAEMGLKPAGGQSKKGEEIQVCVSHIGRNQTINKIKDWANGIFVSPSIFYCAHPAYAKEIFCYNELWKIFVEVRVKPNSYSMHKSTCSNYVLKIGESEMLEYRIKPENEKDVQVISLTFVKSKFFEGVKNFNEGKIFL